MMEYSWHRASRVGRLVWAFSLFSVAAAMLPGCDDGKVGMVPVTGTVKYQGKPIPYGRIIFAVDGTRNGEAKIMNGEITEPTTYEPNDGIPVGMAKLGVFGFERAPTPAVAVKVGETSTAEKSPNPGQASGCGPEVLPPLVPEKYNRTQTSGLTMEITARGPNQLNLDLE